MERIYPTAIETIGSTPLVRLDRLFPDAKATVLVKLEYRNPAGSVKDRPAWSMIEAAERAGILTPETEIIEPTSGNMGIALAFIAAIKGYHLTLTMPESMSVERRALLGRLGAKLELTFAATGMKGAIERAKALVEKNPAAWMPQQFSNPANPAAHEKTTGPEIWRDTDGAVDIFVAGVGTGGTITGTMRYLKGQKATVSGIAVEPAESAILSGSPPGPHGIQGIGAGFIPDNLDQSLVDAVETVTTAEAIEWARKIAKVEGLLVGISSGAVLAVLSRLAYSDAHAGKTVVGIVASGGERYLSTKLYEDLIGV